MEQEAEPQHGDCTAQACRMHGSEPRSSCAVGVLHAIARHGWRRVQAQGAPDRLPCLQTGPERTLAGALRWFLARHRRCLSPSGVLAYPAGRFSVGEARGTCAEAQTSPCAGTRVRMGTASTRKPDPCGQDVGQEIPRSTPKRFDAEARIMSHPAWLTSLHGGALVVLGNSLAWEKTVQTLRSPPLHGHAPRLLPSPATCPGARLRLRSADAQRLAPPGST